MLIVYIVEIPINFFYFPIKIIPLVMHEGILSAISIDSNIDPPQRENKVD